jgi:hypothetical protein
MIRGSAAYAAASPFATDRSSTSGAMPVSRIRNRYRSRTVKSHSAGGEAVQ